ncbi:hypothetical protein BDV59DRAFT_97453 [Aspergillus ambiguus]|uniref:uncharacterized protein n=1 Tax=Aspergillus ambiguus TaxID=176160 RepID=UPI003CCC95FC
MSQALGQLPNANASDRQKNHETSITTTIPRSLPNHTLRRPTTLTFVVLGVMERLHLLLLQVEFGPTLLLYNSPSSWPSALTPDVALIKDQTQRPPKKQRHPSNQTPDASVIAAKSATMVKISVAQNPRTATAAEAANPRQKTVVGMIREKALTKKKIVPIQYSAGSDSHARWSLSQFSRALR